MTVSTEVSRVVVEGDGATTVFSYTFPIPGTTTTDQTNARLTFEDTDGTLTILSTGLWSITGVSTPASPSTGGTFTYDPGSPITTGTFLALERTVPYEQTTTLSAQGAYSPEAVEAALDNLAFQTQQLNTKSGLSIRAPVTDTALDDLPTETLRASRYLAFDSAGQPTVAGQLDTSALTVTVETSGTTVVANTLFFENGTLVDAGGGVAQYTPAGGLSSTLTSAHVYVGNGSNVATDVAVSGDATLANTGALTIANSAVSNAKMANVSTATFKGRTTAGTGAPEDLTATQATALLNAAVGDSGSGVTKGLVPTATTGNASTAFLRKDMTYAIPAGTGISTTLTSAHILVGNGSNVATDVALSGDATMANTGAITIANAAVTNAKLANVSTATFKGRTTAGTGAPEDLTATQATALLNEMVGDSGSGVTKGLVPAATTGSGTTLYLRKDGTWAAPSGSGLSTTLTSAHLYVGNGSNVATDVAVSGDVTLANTGAFTLANTAVTPASYTNTNLTVDSKGRITAASTGTAGSSGLTWLNTFTASNQATLDCTGFISATYDVYKFVLTGFVPITNNADLEMRIGTGGGPTYDTGNNYVWMLALLGDGGSAANSAGTSVAFSKIFSSLSTTAGWGGSAEFQFNGFNSTSLKKNYHGTGISFNNSNVVGGTVSGSWLTAGTAVTAIRFLMSSGNISLGTVMVYGLQKS